MKRGKMNKNKLKRCNFTISCKPLLIGRDVDGYQRKKKPEAKVSLGLSSSRALINPARFSGRR
jgi:hypothetical protein